MLPMFFAFDYPGDGKSFERLYDKYVRLVYTCAVRRGLDEFDAQDCVQDTFTYVAEHYDKIKTLTDQKSYIAAIANGCAVGIYRKNKKYEATDPDALEAFAPDDGGADPESACTAADVADALALLDETDRRVLILRYDNGMTYKEIARVTGLAEDAVRQRVSRAKKKLAELLEVR